MRFHCGFAIPYSHIFVPSTSPDCLKFIFSSFSFFFFFSSTSDAINIYIGQVSGFTVPCSIFFGQYRPPAE